MLSNEIETNFEDGEWITKARAAVIFEVSERTIENRIKSGVYPSKTDEGKTLVFVKNSKLNSKTNELVGNYTKPFASIPKPVETISKPCESCEKLREKNETLIEELSKAREQLARLEERMEAKEETISSKSREIDRLDALLTQATSSNNSVQDFMKLVVDKLTNPEKQHKTIEYGPIGHIPQPEPKAEEVEEVAVEIDSTSIPPAFSPEKPKGFIDKLKFAFSKD